MKFRPKFLLLVFVLVAGLKTFAQDEDLLKLAGADKPKKEYVYNAFKAPRVIMSHSMEMLQRGVLNFVILHRFDPVSGGAYEFFGLDAASTRLGLDYGINKDLTVGIGRSATKELDAFIKYRLIHQSTGLKSFPLSVVLVAGAVASLHEFPKDFQEHDFSERWSYYWQAVIGRKFSEAFTLQISPMLLHRNLVDTSADHNDLFAPGIGGRIKLSKRVSFNFDYYYVINQDKGIYPYDSKRYNPLSVGFDIETGGHVFQLHFSNSKGMNERAFIASTEYDWGKGEICFGFNISRAFQVGKKKSY
jgi:hypothetical protein